MKTVYLDIMEKALSAYTPEGIRAYIDEVKEKGLTEHGFPRLGANIGILMAYGRCTELMDTFIEIMDLCCDWMPRKKAANEFSIREVCCCLMLLEEKEVVSKHLLEKWKKQLTAFDPWKYYSRLDDHSGKFVSNWTLFAAVSEYMRGVYCGIDTSDFVDWQLPGQLANLDCNGMYQGEPPVVNPMLYDMVGRGLFAFLLRAGYNGKYAQQIRQALDSSAALALQMQSVTGELPYGGRSNQFLHNEAWMSALCEMEAARFAQQGDMAKAGEFKAAAALAAEKTLQYLNFTPIRHVKNRYDVATKIGCEAYGYFNKYMITTASNVYMGLLFADDKIVPTVAPVQKGGYVAHTSEHFHKTFLTAGGYHIELDTNADLHYDASGLGRVHKAGAPSAICLSLPFAPQPKYVIEKQNPSPMSLCCFAEKDGKVLLGADTAAQYRLVSSQSDENAAEVRFDVVLDGAQSVMHCYRVSEKGVDITLSGGENIGFMLPVFDFDGTEHTEIAVKEHSVSVSYQNAVCKYFFDGTILPDYRIFQNRNGNYRVYKVYAKNLHIEIEEMRNEG